MQRTEETVSWSRRLLEAGFFVTVVGILWTVDTLTKFNVPGLDGSDPHRFKLIVHQLTSALVVLLLIPVVAWWLTRFPLQRGQIASAIAGHLLGSALFAAFHYFLMVLFRYAIYSFSGYTFIFSDYWIRNLIVEYQKDIKIYLAIIGIVTAYRYYRRQEASAVSARPDRLVVQTGSGEAIIRQSEIEFLEAARNYVVVGTGEKEYLLRETLANLEKTLLPQHIVRSHRSYLVNIDRVQEIRATGSGGHEITMQSGKLVPLSRAHREKFKLSI